MPTLTATSYLAYARDAMQYVKSKVTFGSSNKFWDNLSTLGITALAVGQAYKIEADYLKAANVPLPTPGHADWSRYGLQYIEAMSQAALTMGAGNCEELAAIAFMYLRNRGIRPLDYMMIPDRHAFVVLGADVRPANSNFLAWTAGQAMVCDPWAGRCEPADRLSIRYPSETGRMFSSYRVE